MDIFNYVPNPSFEQNITDSWSGYTTSGITVNERDTVNKVIGAASLWVKATGASDGGASSVQFTLPAGTYYASAYVKCGAGVSNVCTALRTTDYTTLFLSNKNAEADWVRIGGVFTLASEKLVEWILGLGSYGAASAGEAWWDGISITNTASLVDYFDGDTPDDGSYVYSWLGSAHNSVSKRADYVAPSQGSRVVWGDEGLIL